MTLLGLLRQVTWWAQILKCLIWTIFIIYALSMFIIPWIDGKGSFYYVQAVWYDWQALNVGMLAFSSSLIAFSISKYNAEKQRERNFTAAKAFLPDSLSELCTYFNDSAKLLKEAWKNSSEKRKIALETPIPQLPTRYKEVFSRCIETAEAGVGNYLAYVIICLQIHHSRIESLNADFTSDRSVIIPENVISYIYSLGELQALINRLFEFARGVKKFDDSNLSWGDFCNSFLNLNIDPTQINDLIGFTKRAIERRHNENNT